jgi:tol-pal system protein YbgF
MRVTGAVLLVLLAVSVSPAAAAANKEHLQLMAEIRMLQEQIQQTQGLLGALQDTLKTVTSKLDDQSAATRKAMADQTLAVNNIGDNVRVLREKTDETNVRMSSMAQELESLRQSIASQPSPQAVMPQPGGTGAVPDPSLPPGTVTTPPPNPPPSNAGISPQRMYDASYDDYSSARYDLAVQGFQNFIATFPRLPQAADAQYNIGMSYFNQAKWPEAKTAFEKVISDYPQQPERLSDAYYKLGMTFEQLKQIDNAKKAYDMVVQKFPNTKSFALANQALIRLNRPVR